MTNAERLKVYRAEAAARGDCYICRCRPAKEGRRNCQDCLDRIHAGAKKRRKARTRQCVCNVCGADRPRGQKRCEACAEKALTKDRARKASLIMAGTCTRCRTEPAKEGRLQCHACLAEGVQRATASMRERHANGLCCVAACRKKLASAWYCAFHTKVQRGYQRAYAERQRAA